ncbi:hypothetical protein [Gracilimonas mengyeensis]|uniref:Uncharacterized protein n=1 Tax=Gracilimonas mengyeensis TaxID=1302730 RepID=A0A521BMA0_9BACT|nr:hypothetical protein [Gracilimonas mengyeensis]SMO48287.1 hypothetical protein SAMN06265219_102397 [Gracilimonas mengyeensis]
MLRKYLPIIGLIAKKHIVHQMTLKAYLHKNLDEIKNYEQHGFSWGKYERDELLEIEDFRQLLTSLGPNRKLNRDDVISAFRDQDLYRGFVLTMMWGGINATRPSVKGDTTTTHFYKALSVGKVEITKIIEGVRKDILSNRLGEAYHAMASSERHIPGVGESYFTKLFYFLGEAENVSPLPLIFDKWTKLIHANLLVEEDGIEELRTFYSDSVIKKKFLADKVGLAYTRSNLREEAYIDYVNRMNQLASDLNIHTGKLEGYLFGFPLRGELSKTEANPRVWVHNHLKKSLL